MMTRDQIDEIVKAEMKRRLQSLERRAQVALMFYPPDKLVWQYHYGEDAPRLKVLA